MAGASNELGDVLDAGIGCAWGVGMLAVAQDAKDGSQLPDRFVASVLDRLERLASVAGLESLGPQRRLAR